MARIVILKFNAGKGNYWGNEKRPDGVGLQTHPFVARGVCEALASSPLIYVANRGRFFGPMRCESTIERIAGFFRFNLTGNLQHSATGIFSSSKIGSSAH